MSAITESSLPASWKNVRLGDVAKTTSGGTPRRDRPQFYGGNIPWVKSGELGDSTVYETSETITEEAIQSSNAKVFPKGTLCIALYGATVGKLGILGIDAATNQAVCAIFPPDGLDTRYLYRFFESKRRELVEQGKGGAQPNISQGIIRDTYIPVPPLPEQRRIVAEIEKQFTRLEAGMSALRRVQANLKRYRAAVLKAACEGRLVPTEAELHRKQKSKTAKFESGEELLARIRKVKADKIRNGELRKPRTIDEAFLTEPDQSVPEGWALGRVEDFGAPEDNAVVDGPFGSNLKLTDYTPEGKYPVITITNIDEGFVLASLRKVTEEKFEEVKRSAVRAGDILVAKIGSSFGKTGIYPNHMPVGIIPANLLKITPAAEMNWKYLFYHLRSRTFKQHLDTIVQYTAQPAFNVSKFKLLPVPIPPLAEQARIVAEVERRLSVVEELESVVTANLQRATRLRQSILQKAFAGEL